MKKRWKRNCLLLAATTVFLTAQFGGFQAEAKPWKQQNRWKDQKEEWKNQKEEWKDHYKNWKNHWKGRYEDFEDYLEDQYSDWEDYLETQYGDWEDRYDDWEDFWDDWDDHHHDWDDDDDDDDDDTPEHVIGGNVNIVYFCEEDGSEWPVGDVWAAGLIDGKGNINSSEMTNIPAGYKLKSVGDYYYGGEGQLRVQVVPEQIGGMVNVIYFWEENNTVWANGEIWAAGLINGKGNVNSSEMTNVPEGYELKILGDYYYDGSPELRVQVVPISGGYVTVEYFYRNPMGYIEGTIVDGIWASQLIDGKGNVNSSEMTGIPAGYHLKVLGDYYYGGEGNLKVEILKD